MEKDTFESLGFKGIEAILKPKSENRKMYDTIGINEPLQNIKNFLVHIIYEYVMAQMNGKPEGFLGAAAYLMDGDAIMVYTGTKENRTKVFSAFLEQKNVGNVREYITGYFKTMEPKGLALIQEIPPVKEGEYHFRIIHEKPEDRECKNIITFPGALE